MNEERHPSVRVRVDGDPISALLWHIGRFYCRVFHHFAWSGPDPMPEEGGCILVCNHRSSVDPFILSASTKRIISFLVAEEYCRIPLLRSLFKWMGCISVRRDHKDVAAARKALKALKAGRLICIFPEGGINRGFEHSKLGVGYLALRSGAPVVPAYIQGTPRTSSIWVSLFTPSRARVRFGTPHRFQDLSHDKLDRGTVTTATARIMEAVGSLSA